VYPREEKLSAKWKQMMEQQGTQITPGSSARTIVQASQETSSKDLKETRVGKLVLLSNEFLPGPGTWNPTNFKVVSIISIQWFQIFTNDPFTTGWLSSPRC